MSTLTMFTIALCISLGVFIALLLYPLFIRAKHWVYRKGMPDLKSRQLARLMDNCTCRYISKGITYTIDNYIAEAWIAMFSTFCALTLLILFIRVEWIRLLIIAAAIIIGVMYGLRVYMDFKKAMAECEDMLEDMLTEQEKD